MGDNIIEEIENKSIENTIRLIPKFKLLNIDFFTPAFVLPKEILVRW
jgi:hypothetical protein